MSSSCEINIDDCLAAELAHYLASMFDATGNATDMMRMATKSTLKNGLRVKVCGKPTTVIMTFQLCSGQYLGHQMHLSDFIMKF